MVFFIGYVKVNVFIIVYNDVVFYSNMFIVILKVDGMFSYVFGGVGNFVKLIVMDMLVLF